MSVDSHVIRCSGSGKPMDGVRCPECGRDLGALALRAKRPSDRTPIHDVAAKRNAR